MKVDLTAEERNLLSLSFKNVIGIQRHAWRVCSSVEEKEETKGRSKNVEHTRAFRADIEAELTKICQDVLNTIDEYLIDSVAGNPESQAFYHKMKVRFSARPLQTKLRLTELRLVLRTMN